MSAQNDIVKFSLKLNQICILFLLYNFALFEYTGLKEGGSGLKEAGSGLKEGLKEEKGGKGGKGDEKAVVIINWLFLIF